MAPCRCGDIPIFWSTDADAYAGAHLVREEVAEDGTMILRCMASGRRWLQDHPLDETGTRTLRLRWAEMTPADVVAYLAAEPGLDAVLLTMDPAVEHQPLPDAPVLHGLRELRDYTDRYLREKDPPRSAALSVLETDDEALVLGHVSHNRGGRYVEHRPAAWLVTVRDARVVRVRAFSDWGSARQAGGFDAAQAPSPRRLGSPLISFLRALAPGPAFA